MPPSPPPLECHWADERIESFVDDELSPADRERVERHLRECPGCDRTANEALRVKQALGDLPPMWCPDRVVEAARREALTNDVVGRPRRRIAAAWMAALAASLALVWLTLPQAPKGRASGVGVQSRRVQEAERALIELQQTLSERAADIGHEAIEHGVARPARTVVTAVRNSQLGHWGAVAAGLFTPSEETDSDAT